ncbi:muconolactone Delta-isomerase [Chondrinema litorale]|uniref:muconolactone Delta-isomerase n=1 Tax=Chondrinema litorale TaxID=2994555 RepID=UPI002543A74D|nr:muconolactone Delta-isomerase [Chondrinema litorale]UZR97157.1 muconolactone Delta-isomerase [Chondrinema litorale]
MLFHVEMTVNIPSDLDKEFVEDLKAREKALAKKLQEEGKWVHLWRIVGQYANISIFDVADNGELHDLLTSLPLFPYMDMKVMPLCKHYSSIK